MKIETVQKVITPAVAEVVEKTVVITLTMDEARTLHTLAGYDSTVPTAMRKIGGVDDANSVLKLFRSLREGGLEMACYYS